MRTKPYTTAGIKRVPCFRCAEPSVHQWQICADKRQYRGLCARCDIALNETVLKFMRLPTSQIDAMMARYIAGFGPLDKDDFG